MKVDLEALNQVLERNEQFILKKPITADSNLLYCCYIEHLIAKIITGYNPLLYYHSMERTIKHSDKISGIWDVPEYFNNLSHEGMPIPTNPDGYYNFTPDNLTGVMGIYYDNLCVFEETAIEIRNLYLKDAELTEEDAFYMVYPEMAVETYNDEELEECYDSYQAYKLVGNTLYSQKQIADEEIVSMFLDNIPENIQESFQEKAPEIACAYVSLVFTLLYTSGDSAYNSGLFISLHYSDSIILLEKRLKRRKSDNISKLKLSTYNKALKLMKRPTYVVDSQIQAALNTLNNLAPTGTCFVLSGYTDNLGPNKRLYPNAGFYIGAITADILAEEILSELYAKED
ncbi:MAG: hypothetical protein IJN92_10200 [Lachnospiraceae bacterium]|nr:hypothetical protein [Lachnospiraceae bacterium]